MTEDDGTTQLWSDAVAKVNSWRTRQRNVLAALNLLLTSMFKQHLQGTRLPALRDIVALAVPASRHAAVRARLHVTL